MQRHPLGGVGQVGLLQRVVEETRDASQQELEVLVAVDAGQVVDEQVVRQALNKILVFSSLIAYYVL